MELDPRSLMGLAGAPVVLALVQLVKVTFPGLESRFVPAIVLGLAIGVNLGVAAVFGLGLGSAAVIGVVTGLSASGLYSWSTAAAGPVKGGTG